MKTSSLPLVIDAQGVTRRFGKVAALSDVTLGIEAARITALLGPNGAGKTSFVNLVLGRSRPDSGSLSTLGAAPGSATAREGSGVMLQSAALAPQLCLREHLELHAGYYANPVPVDEVLARLDLTTLANRRYGALSGGQQRRLQLAVAICGKPRLLVLDEPTLALDSESRRLCWAVIRELADAGTAVLLTTHLLDEAQSLADRVVLLAGGKIVADATPDALRARVAEQQIRCRSGVTTAEAARLPAVLNASRDDAHLLIRSSDAAATLRALFALDPALSELEVARASLEDALDHLLRMEAA
jgi:ABC-2 type transport system ATP-binding protein